MDLSWGIFSRSMDFVWIVSLDNPSREFGRGEDSGTTRLSVRYVKVMGVSVVFNFVTS